MTACVCSFLLTLCVFVNVLLCDCFLHVKFIVLELEREGLFFLQVVILPGLSCLRTGEVAQKRGDIVCGGPHSAAL